MPLCLCGRIACVCPDWSHAVPKKHVFQVIIEQDEAGYFVAECPALRACYTQGKTYEEAIENIRDVIALCLEDLKGRKKNIPRQPEIIGVRRLEIAV